MYFLIINTQLICGWSCLQFCTKLFKFNTLKDIHNNIVVGEHKTCDKIDETYYVHRSTIELTIEISFYAKNAYFFHYLVFIESIIIYLDRFK